MQGLVPLLSATFSRWISLTVLLVTNWLPTNMTVPATLLYPVPPCHCCYTPVFLPTETSSLFLTSTVPFQYDLASCLVPIIPLCSVVPYHFLLQMLFFFSLPSLSIFFLLFFITFLFPAKDWRAASIFCKSGTQHHSGIHLLRESCREYIHSLQRERGTLSML